MEMQIIIWILDGTEFKFRYCSVKLHGIKEYKPAGMCLKSLYMCV
jgi:hypothetical protein